MGFVIFTLLTKNKNKSVSVNPFANLCSFIIRNNKVFPKNSDKNICFLSTFFFVHLFVYQFLILHFLCFNWLIWICFHSFLQDIASEEWHSVLIRISAVAEIESVSSLQSILRHRILGNGFPRLTKQGKKVRKRKVVFHTKTQFSFCKTILHRVSFLLLWSHYWIENNKTAKQQNEQKWNVIFLQ